jgi:hypothetical protein
VHDGNARVSWDNAELRELSGRLTNCICTSLSLCEQQINVSKEHQPGAGGMGNAMSVAIRQPSGVLIQSMIMMKGFGVPL